MATVPKMQRLILPGVTATLDRPVPAWLAEFDGMCLPCSDAEFYGHRALHAKCEHGDCTCSYGSR